MKSAQNLYLVLYLAYMMAMHLQHGISSYLQRPGDNIKYFSAVSLWELANPTALMGLFKTVGYSGFGITDKALQPSSLNEALCYARDPKS